MSQFESFLRGARFDGQALDVTRLSHDDIAALVARGRRLRAQAVAESLGQAAGWPRRALASLVESGETPLSAAGSR